MATYHQGSLNPQHLVAIWKFVEKPFVGQIAQKLFPCSQCTIYTINGISIITLWHVMTGYCYALSYYKEEMLIILTSYN